MKNAVYLQLQLLPCSSVYCYPPPCSSTIKVDANGRLIILNDLVFQNYTTLKGDLMLRGSNSNTYLKLTTNYVGAPALYPIATNTGYLGDFGHQFEYVCSYNVCQNGNYISSDKRLKKNFRKIEKPMEKLLKIDGFKYDFKTEAIDTIQDEKRKQKLLEQSKDRLGFLAQDLELILPEAVRYEEEADKYFINYDAIIPVLVEALKEQQDQINALQNQMKNKGNEKSTNVNDFTPDANLAQNIPNPFTNSTRIDMFLPETIRNAMLCIYNMQGKQIKQITVNERGNTSITINGYELEAGMYLYSLFADGKEVDTKKMILTEN